MCLNDDIFFTRLVSSVDKAKVGALKYFISHVANCNRIQPLTLMQNLSNWFFNVNPKKKGIILVGKSDTCKTFFSNLLTCLFYSFEIGTFSCPTGSNHVLFYSNVSLILCYKCEEFIFKNILLLQQLKQLFEGCANLCTDNKY